jgi:hypothetical protein
VSLHWCYSGITGILQWYTNGIGCAASQTRGAQAMPCSCCHSVGHGDVTMVLPRQFYDFLAIVFNIVISVSS